MAEVQFVNLVKQYGATAALKSVSGLFRDGLVTCILGPSGCGKTTLLRTIAGLESPDFGQILFDGVAVEHVPVSSRNVGMVFQAPVVYRGLSVWDNVALPMRRARIVASEMRKAVDEVLDLLELRALSRESVDHLNAGDRQKVAIARAVGRKPQVLLLDEPLTNVSAQERAVLKRTLKRLITYRHHTVVYVTHDQSEAMTLADVMIVMQSGTVMQAGSPRDLYEHPQNQFVGWFLGAPGMNFLHRSVGLSQGWDALAGLWEPRLRDKILNRTEIESVGFRPEHVSVEPQARDGWSEGIVKYATVTTCGQILLTAAVGPAVVVAKCATLPGITKGDAVWLRVGSESVHFFESGGNRIVWDRVSLDVGTSG